MSKNYGLTFEDLQNAKNKIKKQSDYLENNSFTTSTGQVKTLLDISYSANLSEHYYSRILNKVNTFVSHSETLGLVPIFLTVTLDGFFRDFLKGNYKRWTRDTRERYIKHIPNNDRNGMYLDHIDKQQTLTPKDLYKILGFQLHNFIQSHALKDIRKDGHDYTFIRVNEPHNDGTPHVHILMYLPEQYIPKVYKAFMRAFPAPRNHKTLTLKNTKGKNKRNGDFITYITIKNENGEKESIPHYETHGFQTNIISATGYILKYILKSFKNLINGDELDFLQAWYIHNRIPRITTTHTLVSQDVYQKVAPLDDDWYHLTYIKKNGGFTKDTQNDYFKFDDGRGRKIIGDNGLFLIENGGKIVAQYGNKIIKPPVIRLRSLDFSMNKWFSHLPTTAKPANFNILRQYRIWLPPKQYKYYISKVFEDDTLFCYGDKDDFFMTFDDGVTFETEDYIKPVKKLSNFALFNEYQHFDFEISRPARYAILHNELIDRSLLIADAVNPNDYNTEFYDELQQFNTE